MSDDVAPGVVRDYIPADDEPRSHEKRRLSYVRTHRAGEDVIQDYVDTEGSTVAVGNPLEQQEAAFRAAARQIFISSQQTFNRAKEDLARMNAAQAVDFVSMLSPFDRNVYLVAEERGQRRPELRDTFGAPDPQIEGLFKKPRSEQKVKARAKEDRDRQVREQREKREAEEERERKNAKERERRRRKRREAEALAKTEREAEEQPAEDED